MPCVCLCFRFTCLCPTVVCSNGSRREALCEGMSKVAISSFPSFDPLTLTCLCLWLFCWSSFPSLFNASLPPNAFAVTQEVLGHLRQDCCRRSQCLSMAVESSVTADVCVVCLIAVPFLLMRSSLSLSPLDSPSLLFSDSSPSLLLPPPFISLGDQENV